MKLKRNLCLLTMLFAMIMLFMLPGKAQAATVGVPLTAPEAGWHRVDDGNPLIIYNGSWIIDANPGNEATYGWNGSANCLFGDSKATISFMFYGTKLRLISPLWTNKCYNNIIIIDGVSDTFSEYTPSSPIWQGLVYEKTGLNKGIHTVVIKPDPTILSNQDLQLDAVDIDDTGYLIPPAPTNLEATSDDKQVDLKWTAAEGATNYKIYRSTTAGGPYNPVGVATGSAVNFTDKDLKSGTYYYVVTAVSSEKESPYSNEVSVTVKTQEKKLKLILEVKEAHKLSVSEDLNENTNMQWTSSDTSVASIDENGLVKALKPGNTIITCTNKDGSYNDKINVLVVNLDLQLAVDLEVGKSSRLTVNDLTDTTTVTWKSDNPTIATVTDKGKVTAISDGLTYVSAIDDQGKEIGRIYIRVRKMS